MAKPEFSALESGLFRSRGLIVAISVLLTMFLGYRALSIGPDTRLERLIPASHEFVVNARELLDSGEDGGSSYIRVAVARKNGTVFDYAHLQQLQKISDELSLLDGVDTGSLNSLWSPGMLWFAITPAGFDSGPVIRNDQFADTPEAMDIIRTNVLRAGIVGTYVSHDFKASMIDFLVLPKNAATGVATDYNTLSDKIERIRQKYEDEDISIHVIGDVKKLADLVDGFGQIAIFFAVAFVITSLLLYHYSRCWRATAVPLVCSVIAVIWQLGVLNLLGIDLGVFSVLVPFLVFAIAVSHGVQMINSIAHETAKGHTRFEAAKITFHHLYRPGLLALLSDGIGFAMLFVIDIGGIKDLAMVASIGVALVIFTNLVLLPVLMSYVGVSRGCVDHVQSKQDSKHPLWEWIGGFAHPPLAGIAVGVALLLAAAGFVVGLDLKIGDLDKGAPELRADSRYNIDNNFITGHFSTSTDLMSAFFVVEAGHCHDYKSIDLMDRLGWQLENTDGVQAVNSSATYAKASRYMGNEGNLRLYSIPRDDRIRIRAMEGVGFNTQPFDPDTCTYRSIDLELADHKQETLKRITDVIREFAKAHNDDEIRFVLGQGNASNEAATNEVIGRAQYEILAYVYGVVAVMVLVMFRSWRAVLCILLPLALTSILAQALMTVLGIGVKVATLPVIALGVGIGVDYGIYIYSRLMSFLQLGHPLHQAYRETLMTTGKAVTFTGITLAFGVATWIFSPIKFQADMGILLTFMFLWNMVGALTLLPALAYFLHLRDHNASDEKLTAQTV